jgi:hypothetical protein
MRSMINVLAIEEATVLKILWLFKLGFLHPVNAPGIIKGIIIGFWRFEIQLILGFWNKDKNKEETYHA